MSSPETTPPDAAPGPALAGREPSARPRDPRSVIDEGMQAEIEALDRMKDRIKEGAVKHRRHWVRLTRLCNQRCIFCLDSWNHNGTYVDTEQLFQYIALGAELGSERLILSGGEPTIHPDYIKFIRHGRKVGYEWIQTVTNGMMFAYPEFTRKAINAGLNEVTVSIHGHTPRLQDRLVGVKGAFDKAIQGIRNIQALSGGRVVINIDVVINKQNVPHLREIIDFFRGMGIHEFDLLYIVPFGRGFAEYRSQLYFDLDEHAEDVRRALEVSREPGVYIWTNRLPPEHLEGFEDLIQDPHKLHSEVQGGLHNFEGFMKLGVAPDCHGERCDYCFLKGLCHDHMFAYRERLEAGAFERVRVDLDVAPAGEEAEATLARQRPRVLHVQAGALEPLRAWLADHPFAGVEDLAVAAESRRDEDAAALVGEAGVARVVARTAGAAEAAVDAMLARVAAGADPASLPELQVVLGKETAAWLVAEAGRAAPLAAAGRIVGELPNFEYMTEVVDNGVDPAVLAALGAAGYRLMNVAPCLGGARAEPGAHFELDRGMLDAQGRLQVTPYVQRYIMGEYYKKSLRCRGCALTASCKGMHIQFLRAFGFRSLEPVGGPAEVATGAEARAGAAG